MGFNSLSRVVIDLGVLNLQLILLDRFRSYKSFYWKVLVGNCTCVENKKKTVH